MFEDETPRQNVLKSISSSASGDNEEDYWNVERLGKKKQPLNNIPLDESQQQRWLESRKEDRHLDMDFLPRNLVYNYGNFA